MSEHDPIARYPVAELRVVLHSDGALAVYGPIDDTKWCLELLRNAVDAVNNHRRHAAPILVPPKDVQVHAYVPGVPRAVEHEGSSRVLSPVHGVRVEEGAEG